MGKAESMLALSGSTGAANSREILGSASRHTRENVGKRNFASVSRKSKTDATKGIGVEADGNWKLENP